MKRIKRSVLQQYHLKYTKVIGWWFEGPCGYRATGYCETRRQAWDMLRDYLHGKGLY